MRFNAARVNKRKPGRSGTRLLASGRTRQKHPPPIQDNAERAKPSGCRTPRSRQANHGHSLCSLDSKLEGESFGVEKAPVDLPRGLQHVVHHGPGSTDQHLHPVDIVHPRYSCFGLEQVLNRWTSSRDRIRSKPRKLRLSLFPGGITLLRHHVVINLESSGPAGKTQHTRHNIPGRLSHSEPSIHVLHERKTSKYDNSRTKGRNRDTITKKKIQRGRQSLAVCCPIGSYIFLT